MVDKNGDEIVVGDAVKVQVGGVFVDGMVTSIDPVVGRNIQDLVKVLAPPFGDKGYHNSMVEKIVPLVILDMHGIPLTLGDEVMVRLGAVPSNFLKGTVYGMSRKPFPNPIHIIVSVKGALTEYHPSHVELVKKAATPVPSNAPAVNNCTCKTCGNKRLSMKEKACWLCGAGTGFA